MTKYDIRFRRGSLSRGQIERYKDFKSLGNMERSAKSENSKARLLIIGFTVLVILFMVGFGIHDWYQNRNAHRPEPADVFEEFKK